MEQELFGHHISSKFIKMLAKMHFFIKNLLYNSTLIYCKLDIISYDKKYTHKLLSHYILALHYVSMIKTNKNNN